MAGDAAAKGLITDFGTSLAFCTRLPLVHSALGEGTGIARASWAFPLVGAVVGAFGALVYWLADGLYLDPILSGILAVAATLLITGALHEDGLGDTADGFGASASRERKLDIMRDSEIGAYGTCALILSFMLRTGALVSLAEPRLVALALIAAHAGARGTLPVFMRTRAERAPRRSLGRRGDAASEQRSHGRPARAGHDPALLRLWRRADRRRAARRRDGAHGLALHQADRRTDRRRARRARAGQ